MYMLYLLNISEGCDTPALSCAFLAMSIYLFTDNGNCQQACGDNLLSYIEVNEWVEFNLI